MLHQSKEDNHGQGGGYGAGEDEGVVDLGAGQAGKANVCQADLYCRHALALRHDQGPKKTVPIAHEDEDAQHGDTGQSERKDNLPKAIISQTKQ